VLCEIFILSMSGIVKLDKSRNGSRSAGSMEDVMILVYEKETTPLPNLTPGTTTTPSNSSPPATITPHLASRLST